MLNDTNETGLIRVPIESFRPGDMIIDYRDETGRIFLSKEVSILTYREGETDEVWTVNWLRNGTEEQMICYYGQTFIFSFGSTHSEWSQLITKSGKPPYKSRNVSATEAEVEKINQELSNRYRQF